MWRAVITTATTVSRAAWSAPSTTAGKIQAGREPQAPASFFVYQACPGTLVTGFTANTVGPSSPLPCSVCSSAVSGMGVIAFINQSLIDQLEPLPVLGQLIGLILLLLVIAPGLPAGLTTLGHHFVYHLRGRLLKQLLDTDVARIRQMGRGRCWPPSPSDIGQITIAFVRLPELLVQGLVLTLGSIIYLGMLSPALLGVTALWVTVTMVVGWLLVNHVYRHLSHMRQAEDRLYQNYQSIIAGSKGWRSNRERAHFVYHRLYRTERSGTIASTSFVPIPIT